MDDHDLRPSFVVLFRECFEGIPQNASGTWFVEGREGILDALRSVSAERASQSINGSPTIAAHAYHMLYALQGLTSFMGRPAPEGTWEDSWSRQTATPEEWSQLARSIEEEFRVFLNWLDGEPYWGHDPDNKTGALAILPHMAYHLGAIRALMRFV